MRVLMWADMEGMSGVHDHRQCWPAFEQYWDTGRRAFTDEIRAAATGLLSGGASEVLVVNGHGLGWPNVLWDELPDRVGPADERAFNGDVDAMFQIGFHSRARTPAAFMAHTMVPGLAVAVDGKPITESHVWAWLVGIPVLGVSGDRALADQLDGIVAGTPFLPVKRATSRGTSVPLHDNSLDALTAFAKDCAHGPVRALDRPSHFTFAVAMDPKLADLAENKHGLQRARPSVLVKEAHDWRRDAQPALEAAIGAALTPLLEAQGELDLSSESALRRQQPAAVRRCCAYFEDWAAQDTATEVVSQAWPTR